MDVFIRQNSFIARIAAMVLRQKNMAITINKTIYLYKCSKEDFLQNKRWATHEIVHVLQYKRLGMWRFIFLYLKESFIAGYYNNRFEAEARSLEKEFHLLNNVHFIK